MKGAWRAHFTHVVRRRKQPADAPAKGGLRRVVQPLHAAVAQGVHVAGVFLEIERKAEFQVNLPVDGLTRPNRGNTQVRDGRTRALQAALLELGTAEATLSYSLGNGSVAELGQAEFGRLVGLLDVQDLLAAGVGL